MFGIWCLEFEILNILMNFFLEKLQNKLYEIQHSEEHIKRRWMMLFSASAMLFVVALWVAYMNFTIHAVNPLEETGAVIAENQTPEYQSAIAPLRESVGALVSALTTKSKGEISALISRFMTPRELHIKDN